MGGAGSLARLFSQEQKRTNVQFELNDSLYFVNFVPSEGRWYVISPTDTGLQRIPVVSDEMWDIVHFPAELPETDEGRVN